MTRDDLIADFRVRSQDRAQPYLFETEWVAAWLAEAEAEAAVRGRLLHESENAAVCEVYVTPGTAVYPTHEALYEIDHIGFKPAGADRRRQLKLISTEELDRIMPDWRDLSGEVRYVVQNDTTIRLVPRPDEQGTVIMECFRLPLRDLAVSGTAKPEIHKAHHRYLVHWALFRALSLPDSETLNLGKAADEEAVFTNYFGTRPDSDLRRMTRTDAPHHNIAW